jgi:hypothetical protein
MRRIPSDEGGIPTQPASTGGWPKWLRRTVKGVFAALAATALMFVYIFGVVVGFWPPIARPRGVPASAHFVSMVEEQTWFDCSADLARNVDHCRAWDGSGKLIADGDYQLFAEKRAATASELRPIRVERFLTTSGRPLPVLIYQFEYDHRNSHSRPLVLVGARDCIQGDPAATSGWGFAGCD